MMRDAGANIRFNRKLIFVKGRGHWHLATHIGNLEGYPVQHV